MKINKLTLYILFILPFFSSCEDVIKVNLNESKEILTIDAFINQQAEKQVIRLSLTSPYFQNEATPPVRGATVAVTNQTGGGVFQFVDKGNGNYEYQANNPIGKVGDDYLLTVTYQENIYTSRCTSNRTTVIDSIVYEYDEKENNPNSKAGYYASFYGVDAKGKQDFYWIRSYKNNVFVSNPFNINYAADATRNSTPGLLGSDGLLFIPPIRNRITDDNDPFQKGDSLRVEIWSINSDTYEFLRQVEAQMLNGGLFARIPENVRTNISAQNPANKVLGWFCVSEINRRGVIIKELKKGEKGKG
ncbi:DUF4249 family protein [Thermoflexibacter ruber]|uniref:DUF4249 domain-containing protein n=1 Tax=Thermoflexibacter ruber TaxID=1003 RepID=A0A1I2DYY3_9BACT|nr:DUF4249 family protein [Thermoflexibacter ruber]SFE85607.1 protein of unknown function [Thermoflexibacter ruber]